MQHLLIIRHTNTQPSAQIANRAWAVTPEGLTRTATLADALIGYNVGAIYTSTFSKTKLTGQILADAWGIHVNGSLPAFDENDRTGVPFYESRAEFVNAVQQFFDFPHETRFGPESAEQVARRFAAGVHSVVAKSAEKTIAIVTHGVAPAQFLAPILQQSPFDTWLQIQTLGMPCYFVLALPDLELVTFGGI